MNYEAVIGLEVHAELSTKTKIFCGCSTAFGAESNTHVCPVCTGQPGALPVLNKQVVHYAAKMGLATHCTVNQLCKSDRKNYFYPDLPKAYQISQFDVPICENGYVDFEVNGEPKRVRFERIHFEEDAGKLLHDEGEGTVVDFNRCGVPLIEMVTRPDIHSAAEAKAFLETVKTTLSYLQICDCRMEEGSIRCDVNVSIRPEGSETLGTRVEMKNINSFSAAERAIEYEVNRQIDVVSEGGTITQETRRWDDSRGKNMVMRSKEDAQDYRYFPDPDLVPVYISDEWLESIRSKQPEFRTEKMKRYKEEYDIPEYDIDIITGSKHLADIFEASVALGSQPKKVSNWLMVETMRLLKEKEMEPEDIRFSPEHLSRLIALVDGKVINSSVAKEVFQVMFEEDVDPEQYVEEKGLKTVNDEGALRKVVEEVIAANPQSVEDYHNGKEKAIGFLVGQTMKAMKGKADPASVNQMLKELL